MLQRRVVVLSMYCFVQIFTTPPLPTRACIASSTFSLPFPVCAVLLVQYPILFFCECITSCPIEHPLLLVHYVQFPIIFQLSVLRHVQFSVLVKSIISCPISYPILICVLRLVQFPILFLFVYHICTFCFPIRFFLCIKKSIFA